MEKKVKRWCPSGIALANNHYGGGRDQSIAGVGYDLKTKISSCLK